MMVQSGEEIKKYNSSLDCFRYIIRNEGYRGFFKGCLCNFYRGISASIGLVIYDELQIMLQLDLSI